MPDLEITFKTKAELDGARAFQAQLERQIGALKAQQKDYAALEAQAQKVGAAIANASKPPGPGMGELFKTIREGLRESVPGFAALDGVLSKLGGGVLGGVAAGFGLVATAIELAKKSLEEFAGAQKSVFKLDAALAQHGLLVEATRVKYQELAETLQGETAIAGEAWLDVLGRLTQAGGKPENIEHLIEFVKNLAGVMNGDLQGAAHAVDQALHGNYTMMHRLGIVVDENATQAKKLEQAWTQAAQRGGGQLAASALGLEGSLKKYGLAISDVLKGVGAWLDSGGRLSNFLGNAAAGAKSLADEISKTIPKVAGLTNAAVASTEGLNSAAMAANAMATAETALATATSEATDALDRQMKKLDAAFQHEVALLAERKKLELLKVELTEKDPEKAARLKAAITGSYGDAENLLGKKSTADKVKAIDLAMAQISRGVEDKQDELRDAEFTKRKVDWWEKVRAGKGEAKVDVEKAEAGLNDARGSAAEWNQQQDKVKAARERLAKWEKAEKEAETAIPGYAHLKDANTTGPTAGLAGAAKAAKIVEVAADALNKAVTESAPRLDSLTGQRDALLADQKNKDAVRDLQRQGERVQGKIEINKGKEQNSKTWQEKQDAKVKGADERWKFYQETGIWTADPDEVPGETQQQRVARLTREWGAKHPSNPGAWRSHPGAAALRGVGSEVDFDIRNKPRTEGVDYTPVKEGSEKVVRATERGAEVMVGALENIAQALEDQGAQISSINRDIEQLRKYSKGLLG